MSERAQSAQLLQARRERWWLALALAVVALVVQVSGALQVVDRWVFDLAQRLGSAHAPAGVVVVAIDAESLYTLGPWPWPRDRQARLLQAICAAQPAAVGVDLAYPEAATDPSADAALAQALRRCGNVVLPVVLESSRVGGLPLELLPTTELAVAAAGMGRVSVRADSDGVVRAVDLWEGVGGAAWPLLAQAVLEVAQGHTPSAVQISPQSEQPYALVRREPRWLRFAGPAGTVSHISAAHVLQSPSPLPALRGQVVLVGATAVGMGDFFATPRTHDGALMPGVEVLANVLVNMRDNCFLLSAPLPWSLLLTCVLAAMPILWASRLMPLPALLASALWFALVLGAALALPVLSGYWIAPAGALVAAVSIYPLWSWRRLEIARRHLDWELQQLARTSPRDNAMRRLGFEQRVAYVQQAQERFRDLQVQRDDTLAFFSHDIRAPLAAAAQQLAAGPLDSSAQQRLVQQLRNAHEQAQAFLSLLRARSLEPDALRDVELGAVLHQAADALYAPAQHCGVRIERHVPDEPLWVQGDFALLERAVGNLLQNALRFAPRDSVIELRAARQDSLVVVSVSDQGPGVPPDRVPRLFQRFAPASTGDSNGLGLYFVHTVAVRLGGISGYAPREPRGARFWLALPLA